MLSPVARRPEKVLALAGKPVASAAAALMERNKETLTIPITGDVEGEIRVEVPYDQNTLETILAIALLPQVALLTTAYAIPEIQRDLNILWRTATVGRAGNLPRWTLTRDLLGRRIKTQAAKEMGERVAAKALSQGASIKVASSLGSRAAGSFIAGVNVIIWIDTGILALTGILDLILSEETEAGLGIDIQPFSPLGEVINAVSGWVGEKLGITQSDLIQVGESLGLDSLAKGGLFMLGDLVLDLEQTTIEIDLELGDRIINLDLDGYTLGQLLALSIQFAAVDEAINIGWDDSSELITLFEITLFSVLLIGFGRHLLKWIRRT